MSAGRLEWEVESGRGSEEGGKGECGVQDPRAKTKVSQRFQGLVQTQPKTHPGTSHKSPNLCLP